MSITLATLSARLTADTSDLQSGLHRAQSSLENAQGGFGRTGAAAVAMGNMISGAVTGGLGLLAGAMGQAVSAGAGFSSTLNRIQAVSGETGAAMDAVRAKALQLGQDLPLSAQAAADGIFELTAGGMALNEALEASTGVAQLAAAHMMEVGDAASIVSATLNGFKMGADEAGRAADVLSQIANASAASIQDVGETIKYVGPVAGAAGQSIEQMGQAIALMANIGVKGSMAGTALRTTLTNLIEPSKEAAGWMKQLGIQVTDGSQQAAKSMKELTAELGGWSKATGAAQEARGLTQALLAMNMAIPMTGKGAVDASTAMGRLKQALSDTSVDVDKKKAALGALGIEYTRAGGAMLPLMSIIEQFRSSMGGLTGDQRMQAAAAIAGTEAMSGFLALVDASDAQIASVGSAMDSAAGATDRFAAATNQGFGFQWEQLQGSIETVLIQGFLAVEPILAQVTGAATGFVNNLGAGLQSVAPTIQSVIGTIQAVGQAIGSALSSEEWDTSSLSAALANIVPPEFASAIAGVVTGLARLQGVVDGISLGDVNVTANAAANAVVAFAGALGISGDAIQAASGYVHGLVSIIGNVVAGVASASPAFANLAGAVGGVLAAEFGVLMAVVGAVLPLFAQAAAGSGSLGASLGGVLAGALNTVASFLTGTVVPALANLGVWLAANLPSAIQSLASFWTGTLLPAIQTVGGWITGTLVPLLAQLAGWLADNLPVALSVLAGFWTGTLQPAIAAVASWVMGTLIPVLAQLASWLGDNLPPVLSALAGFWVGTLWPAIQAVAGWVSSTLFPLFATLVVWLATTIGQALSTLSAFWQQHGDAILSAAQTAWNAIQGVIDSVLGTISGLMSAFQSAREGDWRGFGEKLRELWDAAWQAIANVVSTVGPLIVSAITTLVSNARAEFTAIDWPQVGRDIVEGIARGVTSGASAVANAARQAASNALQALQGFIESGSPSQLFADEAGLPIAQGIAVGIQSGMPDIAAALSGVLSILPTLGSAFKAFAASVGDADFSHVASSIDAIKASLTSLVGVLDLGKQLWGSDNIDAANGIANLMMFVHQIVAASGPARGGMSADISAPFQHLATSIEALLNTLTSLSGLIKLTNDVAKSISANGLTGVGEFLRWFTGVAVTLVGMASQATAGVEKLNTAGLKPLADALGPVTSIVSQTGTLVKALADAMAFDWGNFSFGEARVALLGLIAGSLYLVADLGRFNVQIAALKIVLGPLGAVVQDATSLASGAFGLVKVLVDALAFDWANVNFGSLRAILAGLVTGALFLVTDLERFTAQIVALRVTLGPLGAVVGEAASLASETMALLKTLLDALTVNWGAINFGDVRAVLVGITQIGIFLADGFTGIANTYTGSVTPAAQNLVAVLSLMGGIVGHVMDALDGLWEGLAAVTSLNMTPEQVSAAIALIVLTGMDMAAGFALVANTYAGSVTPNAERAVTAIELAVSPIDGIVKAAGALWAGLTAVMSLNMTPEQVAATVGLIMLTGQDIADGFLLVANVYQGQISENARRAADAIGLASGVIGDLVSLFDNVGELMERVGDGLALNLPDASGVVALFGPLITWAQAIAVNISEFAGEAVIAEQNMGEVSGVLGDMAGLVGSVLDMLEVTASLIANPPALVSPGVVIVAFKPIILWARAVAEQLAQITGSAVLARQNAGDTAGVLSDMTGMVGAVLETLELVASLIANPPALVSPGAAVIAFKPLVLWAKAVAEQLAQITGPAVLARQNASDVGSVLGDMLGAIESALDVLEMTVSLVANPPVLVSPGAAVIAFKPIILWAKAVAEQLAQIPGIATLAQQNAGEVGSVLGDMTGAIESALGAASMAGELIANPPALPDAADAVAAFAPIIRWAQTVATTVAASIGLVTIAKNNLGELGSTLGDVISVIEGGLQLPALMASITNLRGIDWTVAEPKLKLLFQDVIKIAQQFAVAAQSAGITDAFAEAGAKVAALFGDAVGALNDAIDLGVRLMDPETQIPSIGQIQAKLGAVLSLMREVVTQFAVEAASLTAQDFDFEGVNALAESMGGVFEAISTAIEAVQNATGIAVSGSGFNNIRALLFNLFQMFEDFSGNADAVNTVTAAISSMLGGITNLVAGAGTTAGASFVGSLVAAILAGQGAITAAVGTALGGAGGAAGSAGGSRGGTLGGGGLGGGAVTNNYVTNNVTNKSVAINVVNNNAEAAQASNGGITQWVLFS